MSYPKFALYNVVGGVVWVVSLTVLGYLMPHLSYIANIPTFIARAPVRRPSVN
jgi:membrane protein DedA with SNARE-associated domain